MDTEKQFVNKLETIFEKHFFVKKECRSKCGKGRIDMILIYKLDQKIVFGIECKKNNSKKGNEIGAYINQAISYTNMEFDVYKNKTLYKRIPILIAPALSYNYFILKSETKIFDDKNNSPFNDWDYPIKNNEYHKDRHHKHCSHNSVNGVLGFWNIGEVRNQGNGNYIFVISNFTLFANHNKTPGANGLNVHYNNYNKLKL